MPLKDGIRDHYADYRDFRNAPFDRLATFINEEYRDHIDDWEKHEEKLSNPERRVEDLEKTKELILTQVVNSTTLDWSKLELFLRTFDEWLFQLSVHPTMKLKSNDFHDIMMLAYVEPNSLYWTSDKVKTKRFIKSAGCGHYLYDHELETQ